MRFAMRLIELCPHPRPIAVRPKPTSGCVPLSKSRTRTESEIARSVFGDFSPKGIDSWLSIWHSLPLQAKSDKPGNILNYSSNRESSPTAMSVRTPVVFLTGLPIDFWLHAVYPTALCPSPWMRRNRMSIGLTHL